MSLSSPRSRQVGPYKFSWYVIALSVLPLSTPCRAQEVMTVTGTGADAGVSFQVLAPGSMITQGLQPSFGFISCTVPAPETCSQWAFNPPGGQMRLTTLNNGNASSRTFFFPAYVRNGVYATTSGSS